MSIPAIEATGFTPYTPPTVAPTQVGPADTVAGGSGPALDTVSLTLINTPPTATITSPAPNQVYFQGEVATVDYEGEARALMQSWLKIPAQVISRSPLPDWTVGITPQDLAPYITISKAVGSTNTDPDLNALVWQGP